MELVSVIVPVYNVEKYLNKCLESIVKQSYPELEIIVVNDGSTDSSGLICDEWKNRDDRIKVIHKENGGLSSARNTGINSATGNYFVFVDSDDYIDKSMIAILYQIAMEYKSDLVMCDYCLEEEHLYGYSQSVYKACLINKMEALSGLYGTNHITYVIACNKMYKARLFNAIRFDESRTHEDEFIMHKLFSDVDQIVYINCPLYYYYQRDNSITHSEKSIKNLDYLDALEERYFFFEEKKYDELKYKTMETYLDMNIYYTTFIPKLPHSLKNELIKKFRMLWSSCKIKNAPFYKRLLWASYFVANGFVRILLIIVKKTYFSKRKFEYK